MGPDAFFNNPIIQGTAIGLLVIGMVIVIRVQYKLYISAQGKIYSMAESTIRQNVELEHTLEILMTGIESYRKDLQNVAMKLDELSSTTQVTLRQFAGITNQQKETLDAMRNSMEWQRAQNVEVGAAVEAIREGLQTQALLKEFLLKYKG